MSAIAIQDFQKKTGLVVEDRGEVKGAIDPGDRFFKVTEKDGLQDVSYQDAVKAYYDPRAASANPPPSVPDSCIGGAIAQAKSSYYAKTRDNLLSQFVAKNLSALSTDQAIRVAKATYYAETRDGVLTSFLKQHIGTLSVHEVTQLARASYWAETRDGILWDFTRRNPERLTPADLMTLGGATYWAKTKDNILSQPVTGGTC